MGFRMEEHGIDSIRDRFLVLAMLIMQKRYPKPVPAPVHHAALSYRRVKTCVAVCRKCYWQRAGDASGQRRDNKTRIFLLMYNRVELHAAKGRFIVPHPGL